MSTESEQFKDGALQAALKRACAGEAAPEALRQRVQSLMARAGNTPAKPGIMQLVLTPRSWRAGALAAAVLLVVLTGVVYQVMQGMGRRAGMIQRAALVALLEDHDRCSSSADGQPGEDVRLVAQVLRQQLHRPVLAPDLTADGWQFRGGGICQVNGKQAAHLWFARGPQLLSVFSMPTDGGTGEESGCCCDQISGHTMARVVKAGELYCVVGQCPQGGLKQAEIQGILEKRLADSLMAGDMPGGQKSPQ